MGKGFSFRGLILTNILREKLGAHNTNGGLEALLGVAAPRVSSFAKATEYKEGFEEFKWFKNIKVQESKGSKFRSD
jgi:hypothetical protein